MKKSTRTQVVFAGKWADDCGVQAEMEGCAMKVMITDAPSEDENY